MFINFRERKEEREGGIRERETSMHKRNIDQLPPPHPSGEPYITTKVSDLVGMYLCAHNIPCGRTGEGRAPWCGQQRPRSKG